MISNWSLIKLLFFTILIFIFQYSVISFVGSIFFGINFLLIYVYYVFVFYDFKTTLKIAFFSAFLMDLLAFHFFGLNFLIIIPLLFLCNFLLINFLTNKSHYSYLLLSLVFIFFYHLIYHIVYYFLLDIGIGNYQIFIENLLRIILINSFIFYLIFKLNFHKKINN